MNANHSSPKGGQVMSRIFFISQHRKFKIVLGLIVLLGCSYLVLSTASTLPGASINHPELARITHSQTSDRIEAELVTVKPSGFDPLEIRRPPGRFYLRVNNRSGIHDLEFRLDQERGARVQDVRLPRGRLAWNKLLELPPGRYILSEVNHPDWVCSITITAR